MIIFGAGIIGEVTLHACRAKGIGVAVFVDDRIKGSIEGVDIVHSQTLRGEMPGFYLTSPNIEDMILRLSKCGGKYMPHGYTDWHSCGEVLKDFDISGIDFKAIDGSGRSSKYTVEHIKYLIRTCLHLHENYMHPERLTLQCVDLIVTEKCTMKCRSCSNLMQYYEHPQNADLNEMFSTIDSFCSNMDEVYEFRLIGGEPFVHKELHLVVEKLTSHPKVKKVSIFTNGTIVPREHQWAALTNEKVRFFITDYDYLSRNIKTLTEELDKRGIAYVSEKANGWTECAALDKHDRTIQQNEAIFQQCCAKNLATLADGRLYRCPFSANAAKLHALPDYKDDYLLINTVTKEQIRTFLKDKTYINACDHCNGRSYGDPVITPAIQTKVPLEYKHYGA